MNFSVECWLEVYDRDDERLFYGLAQPGEQLSLSGREPIRVVLGNSDGVEVRYNGTPIEFASFVIRGVARFSVGGSPPEVTGTPARDAAAAERHAAGRRGRAGIIAGARRRARACRRMTPGTKGPAR